VRAGVLVTSSVSYLEGVMSAKLILAWILAILAIVLAVAGVVFGYQAATARSDGFARLAIAALVLIGGGLFYVMVRGKFGEGLRLALSGGAFALCLALLGFWVFIAAGFDM
jgi:hypothetical protein